MPLCRYALFAALAISLGASPSVAQQLIPLPIVESFHELGSTYLDPYGVSGVPPIHFESENNSASYEGSLQVSGNAISIAHQYTVTMAASSLNPVRGVHEVTVEVPDTGAPTTTIAIRVAETAMSRPEGVRRAVQNIFVRTYETGPLGEVRVRQSANAAADEDSAREVPRATIFLTALPGGPAVFQMESLLTLTMVDTAELPIAGSAAYDVEIFAVPEPSISLLQATSVVVLAALRGRSQERGEPAPWVAGLAEPSGGTRDASQGASQRRR